MNIEPASRVGPRSLVADDHVMSAEALRGLSCRWRTLVIFEIVTIVILAACGGGAGNSVGNQPPPATPTITTISPNTSVAGGAAFTLTINGTNFVAASMVNFGGTAPATTFVNSTQLTAAIPAASIGATGTVAVTVTNRARRWHLQCDELRHHQRP
jgi:IPT/TIG domain